MEILRNPITALEIKVARPGGEVVEGCCPTLFIPVCTGEYEVAIT